MLAEEGESIEIAATNYGRHSNGANQRSRLTFSSLHIRHVPCAVITGVADVSHESAHPIPVVAGPASQPCIKTRVSA